MSSTKDYVLNIETDANEKAVKFTVQNRPSFFLRYLRMPLVAALVALCVPSVMKLREGSLQSGLKPHHFLLHVLQQSISNHGILLHGDMGRILAVAAYLFGAILLASLQQPSDSIMIMENLGVQLNSRSWWSFTSGMSNGEFIPLSDMIDIVIHEGFHGYGQVIFYMCVLTRAKSTHPDSGNGNSVKVVFPNFLPRKDILLQVWKQSRALLYGPTRKHYRRVPGQGLREVSTML